MFKTPVIVSKTQRNAHEQLIERAKAQEDLARAEIARLKVHTEELEAQLEAAEQGRKLFELKIQLMECLKNTPTESYVMGDTSSYSDTDEQE